MRAMTAGCWTLPFRTIVLGAILCGGRLAFFVSSAAGARAAVEGPRPLPCLSLYRDIQIALVTTAVMIAVANTISVVRT